MIAGTETLGQAMQGKTMDTDVRNPFEVKGVRIADNKFFALMTLEDLQVAGLRRPTELSMSRDRIKDENKDMTAIMNARAVRETVQRYFDSKRKKNAIEYKDYIYRITTDRDNYPGDCPPINILVWPKDGKDVICVLSPDRVGTDWSLGTLFLPKNSILIAFDGETQTEARFALAAEHPESDQWLIPVIFHFGIDSLRARQYLHDYNVKARPIRDSVLSMYDSTGAGSQAIMRACREARVPDSHINTAGDLPAKNQTVSHKQLRAFVSGFLMGDEGLDRRASTLISVVNKKAGHSHLKRAIKALREILEEVHQDYSLPQRLAPDAVWQAAGVHLRASPDRELDWEKGTKEFNKTKSKGKHSPRMATDARLHQIHRAM